MRKMTFALFILLATTVAAFAQANEAQAKAEQIIKKARAAIGDESKFKSLQGLTVTGTSRQTMGERQMESELQLDLLVPDKIMRTTTMQFGTNIATLNGDQYWTDFIAAVGMGGGPGGGGGFMRMGGGPGGPGGGAADSPMAKYMQQGQKRDLMLPMIGLLLMAPTSANVQYTFLAEAPGPNGTKLNAVNAKNDAGLNLILYFTQDTNQLLGIKYKAKNMQMMRRGNGPGGQPGQGGGQGGQGGGQGQRQAGGQGGQQAGQPGQGGQQPRPEMTPEERERRMKEFQDMFDKAPEVDYSWSFSDYKNVNGFNLPHVMTRSQGGTPNEEWTISKYKVNPKLAADKFEKKEKKPQS